MDTKARVGPGSNKNEVARFVASTGQDGAPDLYTGKRNSTRFSEGIMLDVTTDPGRPSAESTVYMHNVSDGGFAFWSRQKIMPRTVLFVREYSDDGSNPCVQAKCQRLIRLPVFNRLSINRQTSKDPVRVQRARLC